jgi:ATP-dependent Clp protease ATP-binding subunit ClpA
MHFDLHSLSDPTFQSLAERRCTTKVIDLLLRLLRLSAKGTRLLNHPLVEILTLRLLLRSEGNVAQAALTDMGIDLPVLLRRLDRLLGRRERVSSPAQVPDGEDWAHSRREASATVWDLVRRGEREAAAMGNDWVGTEHVFIAIVRGADASLLSVLTDAGIAYGDVRAAILRVLQA